MSKLQLPYNIINHTPADAGPVESNFDRIQLYNNTEVIEREGTVAMTGQLRLVGNPVNDLDATPKQYLDTIMPIGIITMFGGVVAPPGGVWLLCDGGTYEAAAWPKLFNVIGQRFGGTGGFFQTPPLTDRMPVGGGGTIAFGAKGGSADAAIVPHTHPMTHDHGNTGNDNQHHTHSVPDHYHPFSGGTDAQGNHQHHNTDDPAVNAIGAVNGTGQTMTINDPTAPVGPGIGYYGNTTAAGVHSHNVSGNTWWASQIMGYQNTGGVNNNHQHFVNAFNGNTANANGAVAAAAGFNMPPYVGVAFIIRAA